jgi:DNA (cytosine-5)-methyltransferase 1
MEKYNYIDLFHGIGGFALGVHWSGMKFENHFCSDIEPYAQKLYKLRFPDSIQLGDITKINTEDLKQYGDKWIITGGFPCQDISCAGKGKGIHGERSGLWFEYWRLINDLRPDFAIMENVGMLIHRGLREVLGSLAEIGYNAEWQMLRSCQFGLPHQRERLWIVAYPEQISIDKSMEQRRISFKKQRCAKIRGESWEQFELDNYEVAPSKWRIKGQNNSRPLLLRNDDGISGRVDRLQGLGNAIVPQIAELLFNQIKPLI